MPVSEGVGICTMYAWILVRAGPLPVHLTACRPRPGKASASEMGGHGLDSFLASASLSAMRLSKETHKEPCFLLVHNPDNIETSESWLEFACAAAKLSKAEPDSGGSPSWLRSQGGAGTDGDLSRGLETGSTRVSVCDRRVHWRERPVQGRTRDGLGLRGSLGDHTLSWSSWSSTI